MANLTIEEQKETYARELAAYTFRQWNAVRKSLDGTQKDGEDPSSSTSVTSNEYDNLPTDGNSKPRNSHNTDGVEAVDFTRTSPDVVMSQKFVH